MFESVTRLLLAGSIALFAASPSSSNFTLKAYDFGNGGGTSSSSSYGINSESGEQTGLGLSSSSYKISSGVQILQHANVPAAPTFSNPSNEYSRLKIILNTSSNPSDTKYEIAISNDSFATTQYVQTDNTVGTTNTIGQYQTYTSWGGASGVWITGLDSNTTYEVKVRALQGNFSGTAYGPTASAATLLPSLTFSVATSLSAVPPLTIGFTSLPSGSVVDGNATADIGLTTNALNGGSVYIKSSGLLASISAGFSISSATADLSAANSGYGAIVTSATQSSGGPLTAVSPFNGAVNNVGVLSTSLQQILSTSSAVSGGTASITLKAKADATTPSASDYSDTLTIIASMIY